MRGLFSGVCAVLLALLIALAVTIGGGLPPVWLRPFVVEAIGMGSFAVTVVRYRRRHAFLLRPGATLPAWGVVIWAVHVVRFDLVIFLDFWCGAVRARCTDLKLPYGLATAYNSPSRGQSVVRSHRPTRRP